MVNLVNQCRKLFPAVLSDQKLAIILNCGARSFFIGFIGGGQNQLAIKPGNKFFVKPRPRTQCRRQLAALFGALVFAKHGQRRQTLR